MHRFLLGAVAFTLGLALAATTQAVPKGGRGGSHPGGYRPSLHRTSGHNYHLKYGTRFKGGYSYKGKHHRHWTHRYWWGKYGCYTYYCPSSRCWYYWYQPAHCYYPCSYIDSATPAASAPPADVPAGVTQIVSVTNNSPGSSVPNAPEPPGQ
jgi:hypothetical protein